MDKEAKEVLSRIYKCSNKLCEKTCIYCSYRKKASNMLFEMLLDDMHTFYKNENKMLGSWDAKKILVGVYKKLRKIEEDQDV